MTLNQIAVNSESPGTLYFRIDGSDQRDIVIPVFELSWNDFEQIRDWVMNDTEEVLLVATFDDPNLWVEFYTGLAGIVFAVVFVCVSAALSVFAAIKLVLFLKNGMKILSVPVIALFAEFVSSVSMLIC
jgi:hypothetical protein